MSNRTIHLLFKPLGYDHLRSTVNEEKVRVVVDTLSVMFSHR